MNLNEINKLIEEKKDEIKVAKNLRLSFALPLGTVTAAFITLACVFNPLWAIGTIATGFSFLFSGIVFTNGVREYKKELKELLDKKNSFDEENKTITTQKAKKKVNNISKTKKSIISTKIENNDTKDNDLTL